MHVKQVFIRHQKQLKEQRVLKAQTLNWSNGASSCHFPKASAAQCDVHGNGRKLGGALSDHSACLPPSGFSTAAPSHVRHWSLGWTINPPSHLSIITLDVPSQPPSELDRGKLSDGAPLLSGTSQPDGALSDHSQLLRLTYKGFWKTTWFQKRALTKKHEGKNYLYFDDGVGRHLKVWEKSRWQATSHCRHFFRMMPRTAFRLTSNRVITHHYHTTPLQDTLLARPLASL